MVAVERTKKNLFPSERTARPTAWRPAGEREEWREWKRGPVTAGGRGAPRALIFDFGANAGGYAAITWGAVSGGPARLCFSEALRHLEPNGDIVWPALDYTAGAALHLYAGRGGEKWRDPVLRGGFRYMLVRPALGGGSAEIRDVELELDFYIPDGGAPTGDGLLERGVKRGR